MYRYRYIFFSGDALGGSEAAHHPFGIGVELRLVRDGEMADCVHGFTASPLLTGLGVAAADHAGHKGVLQHVLHVVVAVFRIDEFYRRFDSRMRGGGIRAFQHFLRF